tara:strand:+ start:15936 stop:21152 length:5217 start_codon:yes stop_codon:yes gene_type:complete
MNIKFNNRRGLPGGPNEVTSKGSISVEGYKEGSPDFNNDFNIIESSNITMEGVPFPVMGTDNFGNSEIMMPDLNYQFPGDIVIEIPLAQIGGAMDTAYDNHPFEKFAESQGMDVQQALQIVLSSPQSYPIEIVEAARDYQLERKRTNPVNDKQDEAFYSTRDQQELEEAQDGIETGKELDSDGEIDEEDFSAFSANMELTNEQKSKSEEIAGYVRNEDGDLMLGVDYDDVTPMGGTAPLGFAGGIPKILKAAYYGSKGLSEYLKKVDGGSLIKAQNGRESKKEKEARLEQERLEQIENEKRINERIAQDFSTDPVEINTEGMRNPLRVFPNPITSDFMMNNPYPSQDTDINYVESMVDYYSGLNDPESLISQRIRGDFSDDTEFGQYSATKPVQVGQQNYSPLSYEFDEDGNFVSYDDPKKQSFKNLEVNAQTLFDAVYPRLTNMTFLDATPDQREAYEAMKKVDEKRKKWIADGNKAEDFDMFAGMNFIAAQRLAKKISNIQGPHALSLINPYYDETEQGKNYERNKRQMLIDAGEDPDDPRFENLMTAIVMPKDINDYLSQSEIKHGSTETDSSFGMDDWTSTLAHELGHITGRDDFLSERDDKILSQLNNAHLYTDQMDAGMKESQQDYGGHLARETTHEASADLNAIRLDMLEKGIYDYRKEQMTKEHWDEYLQTYDPDMKTTSEKYPLSLQRILYRYRVPEEDQYRIADPENTGNDRDSNIRFINNSVADANEIGDDIDVATVKYGAELPSYQDQGEFMFYNSEYQHPLSPGLYPFTSNIDSDDGVVKVGKKEYPITFYNEEGVPMISTDYGSRDHRYLYNQVNELDQVDLIDKDPVLEYADYLRNKTGKDTDFMGIEWERSNYNKAYLRRQQLTNPVFNAVVDPLYGGIGGLQATTKAIDYGIKAIPVLTTGAVAGPSLIQGAGAVLSTPIPYTGTTVGGGLNIAGGLYGGYSLPGDVKDFVEDPSLRTGVNVALDLAGITFGGLEVANMASKFKYSPLLKNAKNPNLKPSYSGITEKQFSAEEMMFARESMEHGYNYSPLANKRVTDFQNRMLTPEFRLRMKALIDEEIIGPGKLFTTRPVTEPGKVNQYELLVNSTIDDMIADAAQMRIVNMTDDYASFRFLAPFRNNNPGAIEAGLPRVHLNKNLPYNSAANIPVTDHEIGHFIQSGITQYLPYNLGKIHPKHFDNPGIRQTLSNKLKKDLSEIYPEYTGRSSAYNTDIDRAIQMGLKVNPNYKIGPGSQPYGPLQNIDIKDMSARQVDYVMRNLGQTQGTEKSYNYFSRMLEPNLKDPSNLAVSTTNRIGTSREGLPYLAELRGDMLQRGFIKNTYDEITPSLLNRYFTTIDDVSRLTADPPFMPRIPQFMSKDPSNIDFLSRQLNKLPAAIPLASPFMLDQQSGGARYDDGGESYGPITLQDTFKDGDDDGLPVGIDRDDSTEVGKDILLLQAMAESALKPKAVSPKGAKGLTQIMPDTLTDYINATGDKDIDLMDYRDAMAVQKWYMNSLYNRPWINKGNQDQTVRLAKTLAAYNWGSTNFNEFLNKKKNAGVDIYSDDMTWVNDLPKETKDYVNMLILRNDDKFEKKVKTLEGREDVQKYINAYRRKGGSVRKYSRLFKDYKKNLEGEKISPTVLKELYKLGLANKPNKKLNLKDIRFNFEYNLDDVNYKKGGQLNLNLNQQIKFYEDYIKGSFDNGPKQNRANQIFKKLNKMYHLQTKKTGGNVLSYLQSLARI